MAAAKGTALDALQFLIHEVQGEREESKLAYLDAQGARLFRMKEVKAIDRATDKVIAVDRQTTVVVDLTEQIAGKKALQSAAARIAERMLPRLVAK